MSNEKLPLSSAGTPGMVVGADSPLLSFLSGISGASPSSNITAPPSHDVLGFSPILSTSNGHVLTSTTGGATSTITSLPLDAELDQLMKSLGGPVDATKVSSEDIDKLLGSINVDFSSGAALSGALVSSSSIDPLAAFSIDIGVDLKASVSLSSAVSSGPTSEPMFTLNPLSGVSSSSFGATDISYAGLHSASPGLPGIGAANLHHATTMSSFGSNHEALSSESAGQPAHFLQTQAQQFNQFQPSAARPSQRPPSTQMARRPPPNTQQQQQYGASNRPLMPAQSNGKPAHPRPNLGAVPSSMAPVPQRPPRQTAPTQGTGPIIKTRPPFNGAAGAVHNQQASPSPAGSPHLEHSGPLSKQPRVPQSQLAQQQPEMHMHSQPRRPAMPGSHLNAFARPQPRPQPRPGTGTGVGITDPSKWLAATMSTLPADQQERLAGLFRGLQAKTIDFQTFVRDAEAIMGPKFQDLLLLMRNQGARTAQMQQHQRPPEFGRPQMPAGSMLTGSPSNMVRSSHPMSVSGVRPGMKLPSSTTAPVSMSSPLSTVSAPLGTTASPAPDSNRNLALMRQYFAQQHSVAGSDSLGGVTGLSDILSFAMSPAMHQSGQQAGTIIQPGGPGPTLGTMHAPIAGHAADGSFEDVITRWRQIILNPAIPGEQLARLSMQLSAYGDLLVSPRGPMDSMSEEARSQQFVQISKLQALIAQRQFSRGPAQPVSQPVSRAESPKAEKKPKEPKKKIASSKPPKDPNAPAKAKKRSADSRKSGSPAPRTPSKKQRTAGDGGSEPDVEMQPESSALAGSVLSPDSALSASISSSRRQQGGSVTPVANRPGLLDGGRDTPGVYADSDDSLAAPVSRLEISRASTYGTAGDASGSDEDMSRADDRVVDYARSDSKGKGVEGDSTERDRAMQKESLRKSKDRREKERASSSAGPSGGGGGGGGMFVIEDVIRCTGVDLREESEIILENMMHHSAYRRPFGSSENDGPMLSVHVVDGVEISRDRSMAAEFANAQVMEALVAKICKRSHLRAVSADAVPYLTLALQDRLRSFMELVSAAAYHRTRTQTLPPPPLDPSTRLPLYKITPHLDVKKQLVVLERVDRMREQARQQQLSEREQRNVLDHQQQHDSEADARQVDDGGDLARDSVAPPFELAREGSVDPSAAGGGNDEFRKQGELPVYGAGGDGGDPFRPASGTKRGRKKDDGIGETAAYTSKNMPDDIRNKISNQTALRAAGGIRKSWMTSGSADWLNSASAMRTSSRLAPGTPNEQSSGITGTDDTPTSATFSLGTTPTRHMASTNGASSGGFVPAFDSGSVSFAHGHKRNRSSLGTASDFEGAAAASPGPEGLASSTPFGSLRASSSLLPLRSTSLSAPLLVTVRDCLFSLERERLGDVRVGRGGGDRVLIQAYNKYVHD